MKLHRHYANMEDANATAWELIESGVGAGSTRVIPGERPVVEVDPAFGFARSATEILEKRRPGDTAPAEVLEVADPAMHRGYGGMEGDTPAPFSEAIGMPVLTSGDGFLSSRLGWKLLSHSATPFSDLLGLKVLLNDRPRHVAKEAEVRS